MPPEVSSLFSWKRLNRSKPPITEYFVNVRHIYLAHQYSCVMTLHDKQSASFPKQQCNFVVSVRAQHLSILVNINRKCNYALTCAALHRSSKNYWICPWHEYQHCFAAKSAQQTPGCASQISSLGLKYALAENEGMKMQNLGIVKKDVPVPLRQQHVKVSSWMHPMNSNQSLSASNNKLTPWGIETIQNFHNLNPSQVSGILPLNGYYPNRILEGF